MIELLINLFIFLVFIAAATVLISFAAFLCSFLLHGAAVLWRSISGE